MEPKSNFSQKIIQNFLRYLISKGVSTSSLKYYKSDISNFLSWAGDRKVDNKLVREYINNERLTTPLSTLNRRLSTLRSYANFVDQDFMNGVENVTNFRKTARSWQEAILSKFEARPRIKNLFTKILFNRPNWYRKYHSYALANYIHIAILILFSSLSGYAVYDQVFYSTDRSLAFPTALTRPNRYLSFQGRLTDNLGNPETTATNIVFRLYDASSGGSTLWNSGTCSITPDQDGIFSTLLGSSCGAEIASSVFSENAGIWLGVTVATDAEATPRVQIATVAYALNSETLQGFPAGTGTSTIPYIDSSGVLVMASASPKIQSTSGTFAVEGVALTLSTPNTSNGIITINPDGTGTLNLTFEGAAAGASANGFVNATNANITSGALYGGTVASAATGYNFIDFQSGVSPTSKFSVQNDGDIVTAGDLNVNGDNITADGTLVVDGAGLTLQTTGAGTDITINAVDQIILTDFTTCTALETVANVLTCGTDDGGSTLKWNALTVPDGNLSLAHAGYTTAFTFDSVTTADAFALSSSSLTTGTILDLSSTSTAGGASGLSKILDITRSGTNVNASHTAYGLYSAVTNTGTTSTNIGGYFSASGATNNYGLIVENGSVGIGDTSPDALLDLDSTATTGNIFGILSTTLTTGEIADITATYAPTDGSTNEGLDINLTHSPTTLADNFSGINLTTTDGTALGNTVYGLNNTITLTGNAAKTGIGLYSTLSSSSTTADTLAGLDIDSTVTGIITTGTRNIYGLRSQPTAGAESTGGTTNVYGGYFKPSADVGAGGTVNGYGLYVANGTYDTDGTSTNIGLYVESPTGADTNYAAIFAGGNVGIGTTGPDAKLDSLATTEQLRLTYTDGSVYSSFTTDSSGYLIIDPTGSRIALDGSLQVGSTSPLAYSRFGTGTTGHSGNLTASNDLLISSDLELDGNLYLDGGTIANSAGTATIILPSDPITTAATLTASNWLVENTANVGQAALMVNQTKAGDLFTASASGTTKFTIQNDGDVVFSNKLLDSFVTAGITLGASNETALSGFGSTSIVGALNELKSSSKYTGHNDYLSWANHYQAKAEGSNPTNNEVLNGLFFDTFVDSTKIDAVNSTSSGAIKIGDNNYRVGIMGGQTYATSTTDNDGQTYLGSNTVNDIYYYDRTRDSVPEVLVELGIDPNWYNGVTLSVATSSASYSQNGTIADKNPNLTPSYNGSLIKATGTDTTPRTIYITIKTPTTFDWTNYQGDSATAVTITPGTAQALGSTGVSVTFSAVNYNVGDVFKVASWFIEAEGTNRGAKQQFPERSSIIISNSYLNIIDADTQKMWMSTYGNPGEITSLNLLWNYNDSRFYTSTSALNGNIYVGKGSSNGDLSQIDFIHDTGFRRSASFQQKYKGGISQRDAGLGYTVIDSTSLIVTSQVNDVAAAVIPNQPTQEVTVSGWGYLVGSAATSITETINLPYKFNNTPNIVLNDAGSKDTTAPASLAECVTTTADFYTANVEDHTQSSAVVRFSSTDGGNFPTTTYYCYTWTATGIVSPKQFVIAATGATSADGGTTIINETDGTKVDILVGSQHADTIWESKVTAANNTLYISQNNSTANVNTLSSYYGIHGLPSESSYAAYRSGFYYVQAQTTDWSVNGPVILGSATGTEQIKSLYASQNTSTNDSYSNTIYIGTAQGVTVLNEKQGLANLNDGNVEADGSVKYYTKDYISEEMVGDIRGMWPLNASNAASDLEDVSVKANALTATNITSADAVSGVRGEATDFDGSTEYLTVASPDLPTDDYSYGVWVKPDTVTDEMIFMATDGAVSNEFYMYINASSKVAVLNNNTDTTTSNQTIKAGEWTHIVATRLGSTVSIYINGVLDVTGTSSATLGFSTCDLGIGVDFDSGCTGTPGNYFDGAIDEAFVTATALTSGQIKNMYQVGYRALQSHGTTLGGGGADTNQQLGFISTGTNSVGIVAPDWNNQYMYVGTNSTTLGALSKIQLNSDTNIKTYNSSANVPSGGTLLIDEDVTSLGVGYQLEAVGSAASGVKSMAPDNNANALTGSLFSKTQTLNSATKFAYLWTSVATDASDADSLINIYACNNYSTKALCDSNSAWVLGTTIQNDTNQSPPEREYNFSFPSAGSYMTFKIDFKRVSTKTNTYIERYGATWSSSVGGADLAERYKSSEPVYPGDIVSIVEPPIGGEATVGLSRTVNDKNVIGIVTTNPGIVMDDSLVDLNFNAASRNSPDRPAIALSGRVPVKVSTKNGNIEVGDAITSSDIAGVGVKGNKAGNIIAKALESFSCEENVEVCEGKILVFVNVSWFDPDVYLTDAGDLQIKGYEVASEDGTTTNIVYKIVRIAVNGAEEIINKIGVFKSVNTQDLKTNIISPIANSDLIIDLQPGESASKLAIKGIDDKEVASIDASGNASFAGQVMSDELRVMSDATVSGTLYADNIESQRLEDIEELLREVETNQQLLTEASSWNSNTATDSADLATYYELHTTNLYVTGQTALTSLFVSDNLTTNKIDSLDTPLQIQSLAASPLEIMAGKIIIDTNGNTKFLGDVEIAGNLKINNIIVANNIDPMATESASLIEGEISSNSTAGKAVLTADSEKVRINNNKVSLNTLIYITPITSTQNKVLFVKAKDEGYFEVGFSDTLDTDVEFNWWIIELEGI